MPNELTIPDVEQFLPEETPPPVYEPPQKTFGQKIAPFLALAGGVISNTQAGPKPGFAQTIQVLDFLNKQQMAREQQALADWTRKYQVWSDDRDWRADRSQKAFDLYLDAQNAAYKQAEEQRAIEKHKAEMEEMALDKDYKNAQIDKIRREAKQPISPEGKKIYDAMLYGASTEDAIKALSESLKSKTEDPNKKRAYDMAEKIIIKKATTTTKNFQSGEGGLSFTEEPIMSNDQIGDEFIKLADNFYESMTEGDAAGETVFNGWPAFLVWYNGEGKDDPDRDALFEFYKNYFGVK